MNATESALVYGWVGSPNQRGTIDIVWSCFATIFLCSWSVLFLNVPRGQSYRDYFLTKLSWVAFTIFLPEVTLMFAQHQWLSARQSVLDFASLGHPTWSLRHSFFANMGGFVLHSPDYPPFPVNSNQIRYLVAKGFMDFPDIDSRVIWDKSKSDTLTRIVTSAQIFWFTVQCIGRAAQSLPLTTFEIDTVAFVLCTLPTFYFWREKPLDATTTITMSLSEGVLIRDVLVSGGEAAGKSFKLTPLDFINPPPDPYETLDAIMWAMDYLFSWANDPQPVPITTFKNSTRVSVYKIRPHDIWIQSTVSMAYISIHLIAWNFTFPTPIERTIWRTACLILVGDALSYGTLQLVVTWQLPFFSRLFGIREVHTLTQMLERMHPFFQYLIAICWVGAYGTARLYVIVEAFVGFRALSAGVYQDVNWSAFFPHI